MPIIVILISLVLTIIVSLIFTEIQRKERIKKCTAAYEKEKKEKEAREQGKISLNKHFREDLFAELGQPTVDYQWIPDDVMMQVLFFNEKDIAIIRTQRVKISDIISCECIGKTDTTIVSHSQSKVDNKDMLKRAAVGGVLLGSTGAAIGGATASRNITTVTETKEKTSYKVVITTQDPKHPSFTYHFGTAVGLAKKLESVVKSAANLK